LDHLLRVMVFRSILVYTLYLGNIRFKDRTPPETVYG
jgi:hypothetical protein